MDNHKNYFWRFITIFEVGLAVFSILADLFIPTIVLLGLMALSLVIRHEPLSTIGFKRPQSWLKMAGFAFFIAFLMQLLDAGFTMPIMNRLTGKTLDYSDLLGLQGNVKQLFMLLILSWTLAALGEELAYRGYLHKLLGNLFGPSKTSRLLTTIIVSLLFDLAHTEQGTTGVLVTTINAAFFSWLKFRYHQNLWAAVLAHGFYNSIGAIIFLLFGPIYGLW